MTQNVVTYTVEVVTDNSSGKLLPYLTANVNFETSRKDNVLQIANAALRWQPRPEQISPVSRSVSEGNPGAQGRNPSGKHQQDSNTPEASNPPAGEVSQKADYRQALLWVKQNGFARSIKVRAGVSDGTMTEVQGVDSTSSPQDELKEGLEVIIGEQQQTTGGSTGTVNPFTPQMPRGRPPGR
jgi:HlyD family secretion protein